MKIGLHWILQLANAAVLGVDQLVPFIPEKYKPIASFAHTTVAGGLALYNHYYTPDGTKVPPPPGSGLDHLATDQH